MNSCKNFEELCCSPDQFNFFSTQFKNKLVDFYRQEVSLVKMVMHYERAMNQFDEQEYFDKFDEDLNLEC